MPLTRPRRIAEKLGLRSPRVSVVVPIYNVEEYLPECLDSLVGQTFEDMELLLVDDGSLDGSGAIAADYAARDERVRVVTRPNGGLGAARNTGVREARGRYLSFVDSDDLLPPDALDVLVGSAERTGSDVVCGAVERFDSRRTWALPWTTRVHGERRLEVTLDDHPQLVRNLYTWDKLFRRDFFAAQGLWFREGVSYEDQPIITQLFARARSIDVLPEVVYRYRRREDRSSISQQTATVADLLDRVAAWELSREVLVPELSERAWEAWLQTLFEAHFRWYLTSPGVLDDTYWEILQAAVADFSAAAPAWVWDATPPPQRILVRLAQLDRRDDVRSFVESGGMRLDPWPAEVRPEGIRLSLPHADDPGLAEDLALQRPGQVVVGHLVERVRPLADGRLAIEGWAFLRKVDLARHAQQVSVLLRHADTGEVRVTQAEVPTWPPAYDPPHDDPWCDHRSGRFAAEVEVPGEGEWQVWLRVASAGFSVETPVVERVPGLRDQVDWPQERPLVLRPGWAADAPPTPEGPACLAESVSYADGVLTVTGRLVGVRAEEVCLATQDQRIRVDGPWARPEPDGRLVAELPLRRRRYQFGDLPFAQGHHDLVLATSAGEDHPLAVGAGLALPTALRDDVIEGRLVQGPEAGLRLSLRRPLGDDRGSYAQRVLAHAPAGPPAAALLLATTHAHALVEEVRRRGVELPLHVVVPDRSVPVPDGATPVVDRSAEFHALVATVSLQVCDEPPLGWEVPRPGRLRALVVDDLPQATDHADLLLLTAISAVPTAPPVVAVGQPRLDALHAPDVRERRRSARAGLGLDDDHVVVLHDPRGGTRLEAARVTRTLGERYVVLVRGKVGSAPRCLDVGDHPRPTDLLLAADVVVTGSSPLILEAVAADLPVLLLGPDEPGPDPVGPVLGDSDDVVAALGDLDGVRRPHLAAYGRLRQSLGMADGRAAARVLDALLARHDHR